MQRIVPTVSRYASWYEPSRLGKKPTRRMDDSIVGAPDRRYCARGELHQAKVRAGQFYGLGWLSSFATNLSWAAIRVATMVYATMAVASAVGLVWKRPLAELYTK